VLRSDCESLPGKSTFSRLEYTPKRHSVKYHTIDCDERGLMCCWSSFCRRAWSDAARPREIVLDLDNTDTPLDGEQEGRFFLGYYHERCHLPLYGFCGRHLLGPAAAGEHRRQR
jgi:hypothetical protein